MMDATLIVPIGTFTPDLSRRLREMVFASAQERSVVVSLQSTRGYCWSALNDFAHALRAAAMPYRIRLTGAAPRTKSLLRELGIESGWFISDGAFRAESNVIIGCE